MSDKRQAPSKAPTSEDLQEIEDLYAYWDMAFAKTTLSPARGDVLSDDVADLLSDTHFLFKCVGNAPGPIRILKDANAWIANFALTNLPQRSLD